ncbi:MAG: IS200/IS605 family transposase [Nanoarchaeota archaeon]
MPESFCSLNYHIIFSTKKRIPCITSDLQSRLIEYIGGIIRAQGGKLIAAGGTAEHVHLLLSTSKEMSISEVVRLIKTNSSKWVHETYPQKQDFAWQTGYAAFTVSYSNLGKVEQYISNQPEHHRKVSFQDEFIEFLKRHHLEYNEQYLDV